MPEYPDITVYVSRFRAVFGGQRLEAARVGSPFLLRSVVPPLSDAVGRRLTGVRRVGKRVVWELEGDLFLVFHLMIAGRFRMRERGVKLPGKVGLAAFDFERASVLLTEAGTKRRASLYAVAGQEGLAAHDPGGIDLDTASFDEFCDALTRRNHTLKRALTDPCILSGVGNAYSDEILWTARLSPVTWTTRLDAEQLRRLFDTTREVLHAWTTRLLDEVGEGFPDKVTAFHPKMAVHGRFGQPCPRCGAPVQRVRYADNETNYCPPCQTGGKLMADRGLSRLLGKDWPKTLDELEALKAPR
ncbi:MAG: formamidopyrimidine-DNA glycosylase [Deltaproteobacteria bacterium HGW-Deltaproteobacteria-14]|jgi:formamidopyrimidine-DNA glycosylase|nr:MAG: formamidopyrimidine-DNA glycosylase [Deltaproteobacteria bacterium HGW-Deltaproteobacteria-14]